MTTSISNAEADSLAIERVETPGVSTKHGYSTRHTLASRFLFLILCAAVVLTALAFGTVHYWALAVFSLGSAALIILWMIDGWKLGRLRVSRNPLQLPLLGILALGLMQLLPLRSSDAAGVLSVSPVKALSLDPYSTRLVLVQVTALIIYFAATLVFTDTPYRLRVFVRTIILFGFFLAIFGLTQSFTSPNKFYWFRELAQSTAFGPFINRHHFAGYM